MKKWAAEKVVMRKVAELTPYANNARSHSAKQIDQIAASINEWGWTVPVLVDEKGMLIAGHGRIMAAQKLGIEEVPTMTAEGWTDAQKKAYVIADNQLALASDWNEELLGVELQGLRELDFDLDLLGFGEIELGEMLSDDDAGLSDQLSGDGYQEPEPDSSTKEIDPDDYQMGHTCPKCGFEFDND